MNSVKIAEALQAALATSSEETKNALAQALQDFAERSRRSYDGVRRQPFADRLIDAIEESTDARIPTTR